MSFRMHLTSVVALIAVVYGLGSKAVPAAASHAQQAGTDADTHAAAAVALCKVNYSCCPLRPRTTPFAEENPMLWVTCGVLLWAGMNAATPLGAWGRGGAL